MKNVITLVMLLCFSAFTNAQSDDYKSLWEKVTKLENEGLTKSASKVVDQIYLRAKSENSSTQLIKILVYQSKYLLILEEDAQLKVVNRFKSEIENTDDLPRKHLLENMLATLYWQYFQQNRYRFYDRSKSVEKASEDFRTWDLETLFSEIHNYYQRSLENGLIIQQEKISDYDYLLIKVENSKTYRPTLYDLLAQNALQFYKTDENSISKPAYKFTLDNPEFISDSETFIDLQLKAKDTLSQQFNALKIYQNLLKLHRKNKASEAFVNVNIERLNFVNQNASFTNKTELHLKALNVDGNAISSEATSGLYQFEKAKIHQSIGNSYSGDHTSEADKVSKRWELKKAVDIANGIISEFPNSDASSKAEILKQQIQQPWLSVWAESHLPTNAPSKVLVKYKNIQSLDFQVYKVSKSELDAFNRIYRPEEKSAYFKKLKAQVSWSETLKDEGDFQVHASEFLVPKFQNGLYIIKITTSESDTVFAMTHFQVTDLALVEQQINDAVHYQVIDRNNGQPVTNASVEFWYLTNRDNRLKKEFTTDSKGFFQIKKNKTNYRNIKITVRSNGETGYFGDYYISRNYDRNRPNKTRYNKYIFTDRSIYRPGQTLYFKGIVTRVEDEQTSVAENETITITLTNVNGETLSTLQKKTNDFGSLHGEFVLPTGGLTGNYHLRIHSDRTGSEYHYFSVEEYKRPKFQTTFDDITDTFRVNETISIKGKAEAYAGSNITDAKVVYRVSRKVQYPRWYYWRFPYYNSEPQEITNGETTTDASGAFTIDFKAIPDESIDKANLPIFNYEITADVTDLNGETRSATTIIRVGYHAMTATIESPSTVKQEDKTFDLSIDAKNLNGQSIEASGTLDIYKLEAPENVLRKRPWEAPDYKWWTEAEFKTLFPHEAYDNEHLLTNWERGKKVYSTNYDTSESKSVTVDKIKNWELGQYIIVLKSNDRFGQEVKDETYLNLSSEDAKEVADNQLFTYSLDQTNYNIGDTATLSFGSAVAELFVTIAIEKEGKLISRKIYQINDNIKTIKIPVNKDDLGGFSIHYSFASFNGYQRGSISVSVPYPSTDLEIETTTFRDKLKPGQEETWSFKVKGPKGDKVATELLASMYDASLDAFKPHQWNFNPIQRTNYYAQLGTNSSRSFGTTTLRNFYQFERPASYPFQNFDQLNWFGLYFGQNYRFKNEKVYLRGAVSAVAVEESESLDEVVVVQDDVEVLNKVSNLDGAGLTEPKTEESSNKEEVPIQIRKNLEETAFFFPDLTTDAEGNVNFSFTTPEALTEWKLQLLAHTKTLESQTAQFTTVTQKELMVIPNAPRFLREGDNISVSTKIANLTDKNLSGEAVLTLKDAVTGDMVHSEFGHRENTKVFSVDAEGNTKVSWDLSIPESIQAVEYTITAKSNAFSDGEQSALPILSNRKLVTETLPMWVRSSQTKTFTLDKLKNLQTNGNSTLKHHKLTLEMTSNPAWYALQALPYLMEYPYDCNEQIFSKYYSNAIAQHVVNSNPKIAKVFDQWKANGNLQSNLEKNQELKELLIQETPWLRDAQSEAEQKKRIALLFDLNTMKNELAGAKRKLRNNQMDSGAWAWFNGGRANRYITQHIVSGFGHLKQLEVADNNDEREMIEKAIRYLDAEFIQQYEDIRKYDSTVDLTKDHLAYTQLHYMYARSFYSNISTSKKLEEVMDYYLGQMETYWLKRSLYAKGLMALTLSRNGKTTTAGKILKSLKENSINSEELGMYWKSNTNSWYWYQAPIETQALMIEAFSEVGSTIQSIEATLTDIDNLKIWLLKNKQTNRWKSTKATTEAIYALLLRGSDWLDVSEMVDVEVGAIKVSPETLEEVKVEAGTGYYKTSWNGSEIKPEMGEVTISKKSDGIAWGGLYWQYFEDLDKITSAETPLKLSKTLYLKTNGDRGEELSKVEDNTKLKVGDLVRVRIELRSDRNMEFVHLKDMRASGLEPINVLSQYKWQDGLGYYESTKDASTNFFMDYLPKGIYVFEYDLRVTNKGKMSNGISIIQSMYAPEFSSHSEGLKITVK
ncbi:MG2 domain-containing protein [Winogradskyella maritima]|uniref:Alpha-2-macroglobulin n=1 Tax=Winogradskyella maritima TaxID=1517766 RepID=A0ABV8AKR6_9FLAO|nr:MG2 domain-containing protein [Winogradskyella maritima]